MIGTSATLWLVNISFRFSKFLSESDKKRWEFVSNNFAGEPVNGLKNIFVYHRFCATKIDCSEHYGSIKAIGD